jgi:hypothetical protein
MSDNKTHKIQVISWGVKMNWQYDVTDTSATSTSDGTLCKVSLSGSQNSLGLWTP